MLLPIKLICDRRKRRDGTSPICIQYCYRADKRTLINTGINIPFNNWSIKYSRINKELPIEYGNYELLNEELVSKLRKAEDIVSFALKNKLEDPLSFLKTKFDIGFDISSLQNIKGYLETFQSIKDKKVNLDIYHQIDDYIRSMEKKVCKDMPRIYRNMKEHLKAFEAFKGETITFSCLDLNFYEEFVDFLTYDYVQKRRKIPTTGLKINTIGKTIKQFCTFLRNRIMKKIIPAVDMEGWTILQEEADAVYLSMDEIHTIYNLDLSKHPHLAVYRNDFILGCLTGLRFSDFSEIMKDDVRKDMLFKKQNKSEHWVVIPLRDEAREILQNKFKEN